MDAMTAPRKPGRPPRVGKRASEIRFEMRLTEPELTRYQKAADKQGMSLSQWVREACELAYARGSTR